MKGCALLFRVLVVDDEPLERQAIILIVTTSRLEAEIAGEAQNGSEAISLARELKPDIVFIDIKMPGIDGLSAAREIKRFQPDVDIIVFTAYDDPALVQEAQQIGVAEYLLKPVHPEEVVTTLERLIQKRR